MSELLRKDLSHDTGKQVLEQLSGQWLRVFDSVVLHVSSNNVHSPSNEESHGILSIRRDGVIEMDEYVLLGLTDSEATWCRQKSGHLVRWIRFDVTDASRMYRSICGLSSANEPLRAIQSQLDAIKTGMDLTPVKEFVEALDVDRTADLLRISSTQHSDIEALTKICREQASEITMIKQMLTDISAMVITMNSAQKHVSRNPTEYTDRRQSSYFSPLQQPSDALLETKQEGLSSSTVVHQLIHTPVPQVSPEIAMSRDVPNTELSSMESDFKALKRLSVAQLTDVDFLSHHINRINTQLSNLGLMAGSKIQSYLNDEICNKFLDSIKGISRLHQAAMTIMRQNGSMWAVLSSMLLKTFCNREAMSSAYKKRMSNLVFRGTTRIDEFIGEANTIYSIGTELFKGDSHETRHFVTQLLDKLPNDIRENVGMDGVIAASTVPRKFQSVRTERRDRHVASTPRLQHSASQAGIDGCMAGRRIIRIPGGDRDQPYDPGTTPEIRRSRRKTPQKTEDPNG
jgi:hypothetical protein